MPAGNSAFRARERGGEPAAHRRGGRGAQGDSGGGGTPCSGCAPPAPSARGQGRSGAPRSPPKSPGAACAHPARPPPPPPPVPPAGGGCPWPPVAPRREEERACAAPGGRAQPAPRYTTARRHRALSQVPPRSAGSPPAAAFAPRSARPAPALLVSHLPRAMSPLGRGSPGLEETPGAGGAARRGRAWH